jgi:hypothetical protein
VPEDFMASIMGKDAPWWSVPAAVAIGVPMYTNAAGIIPIVEALIGKGAALGTVLAFMMSVIALSAAGDDHPAQGAQAPLIATFAGVVAAGILLVRLQRYEAMARGLGQDAASVPAALSSTAATAFLAIAANFYELLCTAGFPMVYTRLLTLADLSPAGRYGYLATYNLIYVLPLAAIVAVFAGSLGARKLSEREGRLLKLMSGVMMLELGALLLLAPERVSQVGIAFGLMAVAVGVTFMAAKFRHEE